MKKFIARCFLLGISSLALICIINYLFLEKCAPQYLYSYDAAIIDKIERLENTPSPKIILVGNSNLAFGMDSQLIESKTGMGVVNLGLHGSLGNVFQENMAKANIGEGDLVIICHNNFGSYDDILDPILAWIVIENHYDMWKFVELKEWPGMLAAFPTYMEKTYSLYKEGNGNQISNNAYSRFSFNEYGDNAYPRSEENRNDYSKDEYVSEVTRGFVSRLNWLNDYCSDRGASLLLAGFPICEGEMTPSVTEYEKLQQELESRFECDVISDFSDYRIDYRYFFDGTPHLNEVGVNIRTLQLIEDIQNWQKGRGDI